MIWLISILIAGAGAEQTQSNSPYIDSIRQQLDQSPSDGESYSEKEKRKLREQQGEESSSEGYTQRLQQTLPPQPQGSSYSDDVKRNLVPKESGGAIQALKDGKSQLEMKRPGEIHNAMGFMFGAAVDYDITASSEYSSRTFDSVYNKFAPDLRFFYEYQPFHSEWLGNLGIVGGLGLTHHKGIGRFSVPLADYPLESKTNFSFWQIPVSLGIDYRFNLLRIVRPYAFVGPTATGFVESRSETGKKSLTGVSTSLKVAFGASLLLDWMSEDNTWSMYQTWDVKHYYLTVEYAYMTPITGVVEFANSGITVGMTFEY